MKRARITKGILGAAAALLVAAPALAVDLKLGGYTKLDMMWTDRVIQGSAIERMAGGPTYTPIDDGSADYDSANHSTFEMGAYESRFNLSGTEEIDGAKLKGVVEGDFYGGSGGSYRLRHAYGQATLPSGLTVLAGQYWSNFMDTSTGQPETIDFNGPAGQLFSRNPQLRVTYDLPAATTALSVSVENHGNYQDLPFFTGKAVFSPGPVTLEGMGVVGKNREISGDSTDSKTAWGVAASAAGKAGPVTLVAHVQRLDGTTGTFGNGDFSNTGTSADDPTAVENIKSTGWFAGATLALGDTTFTALYGWVQADDWISDKTELETMQTVHVNVLQPLWKKAKVGLEYQYASAERFDGDDGSYNRVQAGFWYYF